MSPEDAWLDEPPVIQLEDVRVSPPPPVFYRFQPDTVDASTNTDEPSLVSYGMTMPPTSAEALGRVVGPLLVNLPLATAGRVADESIRQLQGFNQLSPSEIRTVRRAVEFGAQLSAYMAAEVLRNVSPRFGFVSGDTLCQEFAAIFGQWVARPSDP